ncbi:MAG TPA: hypothetical protein VIK33_15575 [Anaerolineae bacterium]
MNRLHRWIVVIASLLGVVTLAPVGAQTNGENRAGLVVRYGDGRVTTYCARFSEPSITGLDLLTRSGLKPVAEVGGLGSAVCSISGQGCAYPSQPCFCQCQGASCAYWNYFHLIDGAWQYSPLGSAGYTITNGAVDGWSWGDKVAPPVYTIEQICAAPPAAPTDQPTIQPTIQLTPQPTSEPTVQPTPQPTEESTTQPTNEPTIQPSNHPTIQPTSQPTNEPIVQPSNQLGGYTLFAVVVLVLGGWLIAARVKGR